MPISRVRSETLIIIVFSTPRMPRIMAIAVTSRMKSSITSICVAKRLVNCWGVTASR